MKNNIEVSGEHDFTPMPIVKIPAKLYAQSPLVIVPNINKGGLAYICKYETYKGSEQVKRDSQGLKFLGVIKINNPQKMVMETQVVFENVEPNKSNCLNKECKNQYIFKTQIYKRLGQGVYHSSIHSEEFPAELLGTLFPPTFSDAVGISTRINQQMIKADEILYPTITLINMNKGVWVLWKDSEDRPIGWSELEWNELIDIRPKAIDKILERQIPISFQARLLISGSRDLLGSDNKTLKELKDNLVKSFFSKEALNL